MAKNWGFLYIFENANLFFSFLKAILTSNSTDESLKMPSDAELKKNIDEKMILPKQIRHHFDGEEKMEAPKLNRELFMKKEEIEEENVGQQKTFKTMVKSPSTQQQTTTHGFSIDVRNIPN
jgi:hypothetical protein